MIPPLPGLEVCVQAASVDVLVAAKQRCKATLQSNAVCSISHGISWPLHMDASLAAMAASAGETAG